MGYDFPVTVPALNFARLNLDLETAFPARIRGVTYDVAFSAITVYADNLDAGEVATVAGIIAAHDPDAMTPDQIAAARVATVASAADGHAANIPGWATWPEAKALAWIDGNVTDLASAKVALKAMARMLVALRNKTWPRLEEG
jgi:hypothetical protein